jgi:hypothetical protein
VRAKNREINIFNMSLLDVLSGALGAFLFLMLAMIPAYMDKQKDSDLKKKFDKAKSFFDFGISRSNPNADVELWFRYGDGTWQGPPKLRFSPEAKVSSDEPIGVSPDKKLLYLWLSSEDSIDTFDGAWACYRFRGGPNEAPQLIQGAFYSRNSVETAYFSPVAARTARPGTPCTLLAVFSKDKDGAIYATFAEEMAASDRDSIQKKIAAEEGLRYDPAAYSFTIMGPTPVVQPAPVPPGDQAPPAPGAAPPPPQVPPSQTPPPAGQN